MLFFLTLNFDYPVINLEKLEQTGADLWLHTLLPNFSLPDRKFNNGDVNGTQLYNNTKNYEFVHA